MATNDRSYVKKVKKKKYTKAVCLFFSHILNHKLIKKPCN